MSINFSDVQRLNDLKAQSSAEGILSVYLPSDPRSPSRDDLAARAMNVLRELRETSGKRSERIAEESERVLDFLRREHVPHGTATVIFSSAPAKLWQVFSLQLPSPALARFNDLPFLLPIEASGEDFGPAMVAMVSQEEARFLRLNLGELIDESRLSTDVPGLQRQGGWAAARYEQDRLHHIDEHLRRVAAHLAGQYTSQPFEHMVLSCSNEVTQALTDHLPKELQDRLTEGLHLEMFATSSRATQAARVVIAARERQIELMLVNRLIGMALEGGQAALGEGETLQMLREGRARTLVLGLEIAFREPGETAFSLAAANNLDVELVQGEAARLLQPYAGLAAELRF